MCLFLPFFLFKTGSPYVPWLTWNYVAQASLEFMGDLPASSFHIVPGLQSCASIPATGLHLEHFHFQTHFFLAFSYILYLSFQII